jgi:hypothetical protein
LSSVELTSLAASHDVLGVRHCYWPIEPLLESFPDKSPQTGMMSACPGVDLPKQLLALIPQDAAHEYACCALLVELAVDEDEGLGSP